MVWKSWLTMSRHTHDLVVATGLVAPLLFQLRLVLPLLAGSPIFRLALVACLPLRRFALFTRHALLIVLYEPVHAAAQKADSLATIKHQASAHQAQLSPTRNGLRRNVELLG